MLELEILIKINRLFYNFKMIKLQNLKLFQDLFLILMLLMMIR